MFVGAHPFGQYTMGEIPASEDISTPNVIWAFFDDAYALRVFVLSVAPLPLAGAVGEFPYTLGTVPFGFVSDEDAQVPDTLYWANLPLLTDSTDMPPDLNIQPRLKNAFSFQAAIPLPGGTATSIAQSSFGTIEVANVGDVDTQVAGSSWNGRDATIYIGGTLHPGRYDEQVLKFSEYQKLYSLQIAGVASDEIITTLSVKDPILKLQVPVQQSEYLGDDSDYEGGSDVGGTFKPVALGQVLRVPAVLVDAANYIYQWTALAGGTVDAVYDNGIALNFQEDSTDLPNLSVTTGNYATDVSRGLVKVGDEPSSEIVVDGQWGGADNKISTIISYLAGLANVDTDGVSFNDYGNYDAGFWCDGSAVNIDTVMTELMSSCDGWWIFKRNGKLAIGEHLDIARTTPVLTIDGREDAEGVPSIEEGSMRRDPGPPPVWKLKIGYQKYGGTVIINEEEQRDLLRKFKRKSRGRQRQRWKFKLADTVDPDVISDWAQEFRYIGPYTNTQAQGLHRDAVVVEKNTHLVDQTETTALAQSMLLRDSKLRAIYTFFLIRHNFKLFPGDVITLKHDRFNLSAGKKGRVISIAEDAVSQKSQLQVLVNE